MLLYAQLGIYRWPLKICIWEKSKMIPQFNLTEINRRAFDDATEEMIKYTEIKGNPPYLQVAIDIPDINTLKAILKQIPQSDHLIIEAGTPLIKKYGVGVVQSIREVRPNAFVVADMKTLDTGNLEAGIVADATADAIVISGLAPISTIEKAIKEARMRGIYAVIDMLNVDKPLSVLKALTIKPDIVEFHRAIDIEGKAEHAWSDIPAMKKLSERMLIAVAGGIRLDMVKDALKAGADIVVVGRAITEAKDVRSITEQFIEEMKQPEIDPYRIMTDF
ncbi:MAG: bifunctional 5,6,7,8-tetrahydromethanopterin hydro-lyase/3-hexulose-6-phosphate synthase [ANME-2 cluster archaeon]|nr:MAG: bifunctional 5,6,7,8-tetrahydromethanopterin hydro-lyase/3-hexulose-6-phosphate synthase [ANME-2 cluster archaeon]